MTDYENFQKILPQYFPSIRLISVRGNVSVVEQHLRLSKMELVMMVKHVINEPTSHEIFVIGGDAKGTRIITCFEDMPLGTRLTVEIDFKLNGKMRIINFLKNINAVTEYSKIIDDLVLIAEN